MRILLAVILLNVLVVPSSFAATSTSSPEGTCTVLTEIYLQNGQYVEAGSQVRVHPFRELNQNFGSSKNAIAYTRQLEKAGACDKVLSFKRDISSAVN